MIDRAAIFTEVLRRNALRREACLPVLDVQATYRRGVDQAEWSAYVDEHHEVARAEVLREQRRRYGQDYPQSAGGRWAVNILTARALHLGFATQRRRRS